MQEHDNQRSSAGRKAFSTEKKELIRNNIIAAAELLFTTIDFHDVFMQKIAEKAGIAKGSVYYYFKNKHDLYITIATRMFNDAYIQYQKAVDNEITYLDKFIAFNRIKLNYFRKNLHNLKLTNKLYYEMDKINFEDISEDHRQDFYNIQAAGFQMMRLILQGGKDSGDFRQDINIEHLVLEFAISSRAILHNAFNVFTDTKQSDELYESYIANLVRILK